MKQVYFQRKAVFTMSIFARALKSWQYHSDIMLLIFVTSLDNIFLLVMHFFIGYLLLSRRCWRHLMTITIRTNGQGWLSTSHLSVECLTSSKSLDHVAFCFFIACKIFALYCNKLVQQWVPQMVQFIPPKDLCKLNWISWKPRVTY